MMLEDVEVVMLRRYQDAVRTNDEAQLVRVQVALDVFREAAAEVREWYNRRPVDD